MEQTEAAPPLLSGSDDHTRSPPTSPEHSPAPGALPSILKSSSLHPASRPGTPDGLATSHSTPHLSGLVNSSANSTRPASASSSAIHFSSGSHPEHVAPSDLHPASRPAHLRRASSDSVPSTSQTPDDGSTAPSAGKRGSVSSIEEETYSHTGPSSILKRPSRPNYGGRLGAGPALPSNSRTASSGGLSADIKPGYERRVGFDSMVDADETASGTFGFTLQVKSHGYTRTRNTRTFMCAVDEEAYSERAMEWLMESLVSQARAGAVAR